MTLRIRALEGRLDGLDLCFPDEVREVRIGRDDSACQVALPFSEQHLGFVHCTLHAALGGWHLLLPTHHRMHVDGRAAADGQILPVLATLDFGRGLRLRVETLEASALPATRRNAPRAPRPRPPLCASASIASDDERFNCG